MITISLKTDSDIPMYIQIYEYIKKEILAGRLSAPEKLPSARSLAAHLQVSRSTVDTAYEQLVAEGYVDAREKRGYFVNSITHMAGFTDSVVPDFSTESHIPSAPEFFEFNPDAIDTTHFPYTVWKSIGKNQLDNPRNFTAGDNLGEPSLRHAVATYLHGSRGVSCEPDQVVVGAGLAHLLQMLSILFDRKPTVAFEKPGYQNARRVLLHNGCSIVDIPLKNSVMDVEALADSSASLCYVTPSHQFPMGSVMPASTRDQLLKWASEKEGRYILEDDHDSEFRYTGRPIPALQSFYKQDTVIYIGTFSKAISPALRVGYMILPKALMRQYKKICGTFPCPVSKTTQAILADFIHKGYFEKHLNRMRKIYKGKHDFLLTQIQKYLPAPLFSVSGDNAGLYVLLHYQGSRSDDEILENAQKNNIRLCSLNDYYPDPDVVSSHTYLIGFADLSPEEITKGILLLAEKVFLSPGSYPG